MLILPWRKRTEKRLDAFEREQRAMIARFAYVEQRGDDLMSMMDDVKAKMTAMEDVVQSAISSLESLKAAYDYMKTHEDPAIKEIADRLDASRANLADHVAKVSASGGVAG